MIESDPIPGGVVDHQAEKVFERMRDDFFAVLKKHVPPGVKADPEDLALAMLQAIAREIAEHRLRTAST